MATEGLREQLMVTFQSTLRRPAVFFSTFYCTSAHIIKFPCSYRCPWFIIEPQPRWSMTRYICGGWWGSCYLTAVRFPPVNELTGTHISTENINLADGSLNPSQSAWGKETGPPQSVLLCADCFCIGFIKENSISKNGLRMILNFGQKKGEYNQLPV